MNDGSDNWRKACGNKTAPAIVQKNTDQKMMMDQIERTVFNRMEAMKSELNQKLFYIETKLDTLINMLGPAQQYGRGARAGRMRGGGQGRYNGTGANRQMLGRGNFEAAAQFSSPDGMAMVEDGQLLDDGFSNELIHPALRILFNQFSPLNDFDDRINGQRPYQPNPQHHYQTRPNNYGNRGGGTRKMLSPTASSSSTGTQLSIGAGQPSSSNGIYDGKQRFSMPTLDGSFGTSVRRQPPGTTHRWNAMGAIFLNAVADVAGCNINGGKNLSKTGGNGTAKLAKQTLGTNNAAGTKQDGKPREWTTRSMLGHYTDSAEESSNDGSDDEQSDSGKSCNGMDKADNDKANDADATADCNSTGQELTKSEEMKQKKFEGAAPLGRRGSI